MLAVETEKDDYDMRLTPEETKSIEKCKAILSVGFPSYTGKFEFHLKKEKPNADQIDVKALFDLRKQ